MSFYGFGRMTPGARPSGGVYHAATPVSAPLTSWGQTFFGGQGGTPAAIPIAAPTTMPNALAAPAAKPLITIGPQSDALAKALLAQGATGEIRTPFEALGKLAQLGVGGWKEDQFQKSQKAEADAPGKALSQALAGLDPSSPDYKQTLGKGLMTIGGQYGKADWVMKGAELLQPPGKGDYLVVGKDAAVLDPITHQPVFTNTAPDSTKTTPYTDPAKVAADLKNGFITQPQADDALAKLNKPATVTPYTDPAKVQADLNAGFISEAQAADALNAIRAKEQPSQYRPLTAEERQQWGISPDDPNAYALGPDGKPVKVADSDLLSAGAVKQKTAIAESGRSAINVNPQESKYSQTVGAGLGDISIEITKNAMKAPGMQATLSRLEQLSADPNFYSGTGSELVKQAKKALAAVSGDPSVAASTEAFGALSNQVVLNKIGSLGTGISNADRSFIEGIAPRLDNTPEGNKLVIDTLRKLTQRDVDVARFASQYRKEHGNQLDENFPIALDEWATAHPLFVAAGQPLPAPGTPAGAPPVVPQGAIDALKANPTLRDQFDQKFGPGAAARVLGQ